MALASFRSGGSGEHALQGVSVEGSREQQENPGLVYGTGRELGRQLLVLQPNYHGGGGRTLVSQLLARNIFSISFVLRKDALIL